MNTLPKVGVVILNYKVKDQVLKCLESVSSSSHLNVEIIVVDNNSEDNLEQDLPKRKEIHFIQTGDNLGYAGGNNVGIKKALELQCEYIFVLNPDTTLQKNTIKTLSDQSIKLDADIAGPKILFSDKETIWYAGGILDRNNILGTHRGVDQKDKGQFETVEETDFVTGAAFFVQRKVFEKIGFLDERYFLYLEDVDFCYRAKKAGFRLLYIPEAIVYHKNAQSTGLGSPLQDYFITRNRMLFASKFSSLRTRFALLREAVKNAKFSARRLALTDFLSGKFGKGSYIK